MFKDMRDSASSARRIEALLIALIRQLDAKGIVDKDKIADEFDEINRYLK